MRNICDQIYTEYDTAIENGCCAVDNNRIVAVESEASYKSFLLPQLVVCGEELSQLLPRFL